MANNSLNDLFSVNNPDKPFQGLSEKSAFPLTSQQIVTNSNIWAERFNSFTEEIENEIDILVKKTATSDFFSSLHCKLVLEKFSDEFDILFNNRICEWVNSSEILTKGAEGFDLFKAAEELYISLSKKYSFKLKEGIQAAKLGFGYVSNDEDPEPGGY
jgi:hypothetical protein